VATHRRFKLKSTGKHIFVPLGLGADLGTISMTKIFHGQNQFLRTTKMKLVQNLGDMDKVLDLELNEHIDIS
jgi:hypothetical protein